MMLVKKLKFFHLFCLSKIDREKVFADVLDKKADFKDYKNNFGHVLLRKQAFLDNINMYLKRRQNWHFCKGDSP